LQKKNHANNQITKANHQISKKMTKSPNSVSAGSAARSLAPPAAVLAVGVGILRLSGGASWKSWVGKGSFWLKVVGAGYFVVIRG
jgi:hypothetical protein